MTMVVARMGGVEVILSPEQMAVVIVHMRSSLMSKAFHVRCAAEKCFRLREGMLSSAAQCREDASLMTPLQNKQHRLINNILRDGEHEKTETQGMRLLSLAQEQYQMSGVMQLQLMSVASGLMRSADILLFTLLKAQHYQWRDRLYMAVLTGESENVLTGEQACPLGQWLHGEGLRRFRALPGFRELNDEHHVMHDAADALFSRSFPDMPVRVLERLLQDVEEVSQRLIAALDCLDNRVGLLYPEGVC